MASVELEISENKGYPEKIDKQMNDEGFQGVHHVRTLLMRQKSSRHLATTVDLEHVTTYNQINPEQNRPVIGEIAHSNSEPWLNLQNNNQ